MRAEQARKILKDTEESNYKRELVKRSHAERKRRDRHNKEMAEFDKIMDTIHDKIKEAVKGLYTRVTFDHSSYTGETQTAIEERLKEEGYRVYRQFVPGEYENMGDFNAPCNIWRDSYWYLDIWW